MNKDLAGASMTWAVSEDCWYKIEVLDDGVSLVTVGVPDCEPQYLRLYGDTFKEGNIPAVFEGARIVEAELPYARRGGQA